MKNLLWVDKWERFYALERYHVCPSFEENITRIKNNRRSKINIFDDWGKSLNFDVIIRDKVILEIGCGGGRYLIDALSKGAKKVVGIDVSKTALQIAEETAKYFGFQNYEFYDADELCLEKFAAKQIDVIFESAVFQHIAPMLTEKYLETAHSVLNANGGIFLAQFLMNERDPSRSWDHPGEGVVSFTANEMEMLFEHHDLNILKFADVWKATSGTNYSRVYLLNANRKD